ncbi:MAG: N-acetylmuramoyl-L-alanine amidase [Chthoniobacterales bacterium]
MRQTLLVVFFSMLWSVAYGQWNITNHGGRRYVSVRDVGNFYQLRLSSASGGKSFHLSGGGRSLQGRTGEKSVYINGVKHALCFPTIPRGGTVLISAMDVTKIIEPVLRPGKIKNATQVRTVILDAGHGGHDSGATSRFGREKTHALDVALRARRLLLARGYDVKMTRSRDVFIPLEKRAAFANRFRNAIFVSIHFNKGKSGGGTGLETFCLAPRGVPSMDDRSVTVNALRAYPGHGRDAENVLLATALHSNLLKFLRLPDRGVKRARFHVIRETRIPSVLVEGGFMDMDGRRISSPQYRQNMAQAIVNGIVSFQQAVRGRLASAVPNIVATGADRTTAPAFPGVGSRTEISEAVKNIQIRGKDDKTP